MRRNISLYIGNSLVDLDQDSLVLFNFTQEDLENPTIVKNSYSQQITLKGTPNNNKILSDYFRLDKTTSHGFNARVKNPFTIYNQLNEILESGYVKLDSITRNKGVIEYKITLYGGLGSFLYQLSFNDEGEKRNLADLDFLGTDNPDEEFNHTINRNYVKHQWDVLAGKFESDLAETLNFAPAYNGIPDGFDADKGVFDYTSSLLPATGVHRTKLSRSYTEREMQDMRSYLQRPVLRMRAILQGISRFATSKGWTFSMSPELESADFITKTWLTLPILNKPNPETNMRSYESFTKADILKGTGTPADYLLGLCKTFGLKLVCDDRSRTLTLMTRNDFFQDETIDLSKRVDISKAISIDPLVISSKWYEMELEDNGENASSYKDNYGRSYGSQRIDTGYAFNADTKKITESIIFKGGVQSLESSNVYINAFDKSETYLPAAFLDGGSYETINIGTGDVETTDLPSQWNYYFEWWNEEMKGYDVADFVQLHQADNKSFDGSNVLLYFDSFVDCPTHFHLSDDLPDYMIDKPCWNLTTQNSIALTEIPHFSRFQVVNNEIVKTLDFGNARELYVPGLTYGDGCSIYQSQWRNYLMDRFNENTRIVTLKVNLQGLQVGNELLRKFYWFDNSIWVLNKIKNYSLTTTDPVECEFIQVQDKENYLNGQE